MKPDDRLFEEVGCDEIEDREVPAAVLNEALEFESFMRGQVNDPFMDEYIREYQNQVSQEFEDLVNLS